MSEIGVFWFYKNTVFGCAEDTSQGFRGVAGIIDSNQNHVDIWDNLPKRTLYPELSSFEYEEIPRGRVLFSTLKNIHIVYMDKTLFTAEIKQKISCFFGFEVAHAFWKKDPHYTISKDDLSHLFDD